MHASFGSRLFLTLVAVCALAGLAPRDAHAQASDEATCPASPPECTPTRANCCTRTFASTATSRAIIIPMDRCHQPFSGGSAYADSTSPVWCADSPGYSYADAQNYAYGLVFRLMQWNYNNPTKPITVYWIVNPTKAPTVVGYNTKDYSDGLGLPATKDIDMWILASGANPPARAVGTPLTSIGTGTPPVRLLKTTGTGMVNHVLSQDASWTYSKKEFPIRGGAFLISSDQRANFEEFWRTPSNRTGCDGTGTDCFDFSGKLNLYEIDENAHFSWQDYTKALVSSGTMYDRYDNSLPVAMRIDYAPPKIARVYSGNTSANWLKKAGLDDPATNASCKTGAALSPSTAVGCDMLETDVQTGALTANTAEPFTWVWINSNSSCNTLGYLKTFMTGVVGSYTAGNVLFSDSALQLAEQCTSSTGHILGAGTGATDGLDVTPSGSLSADTNGKPPWLIRYPTSLYSQFGDLKIDFGGGAGWNRAKSNNSLYNSLFNTTGTTLHILATQEADNVGSAASCINHQDYPTIGASSTAACDSEGTGFVSSANGADMRNAVAYGRYKNDKNNGIAYYVTTNNVSTTTTAGVLRMMLSSLLATPPLRTDLVKASVDVTRSSPISGLIQTATTAIVQGSYEFTYATYGTTKYRVPRTDPGIYVQADVAGFTFPATKGHMRARSVTALSNTVFDAGTLVPGSTCSSFVGAGCRTIWTNVNTSATSGTVSTITTPAIATQQFFNTDAAALVLKPTILPNSIFSTADTRTLISRVLKGYTGGTTTYSAALGGVDRSTVAVIPKSQVAGTTRPKVAYFGALDGMLHAVCADNTVGTCAGHLGEELWAFVPRTNLPNLRYNSAMINGSPRVLDVQGLWNGATTKSWKTVLLFQTGTGSASSTTSPPAVYALDITNPSAPAVLWEYTLPSGTLGTNALGVGLTIAAGEATVGGSTRNLTVITTNNGGSPSAAGLFVTALDTDTGLPIWTNAAWIAANGTQTLGHSSFSVIYPSPRIATNKSVPATGIPGGATSMDATLTGTNGFMTDIIVPDLYGQIWKLDAATGRSRYSTTGTTAGTDIPLFKFSTDYHPIGAKVAIYAIGNTQYAVFADGGYVDYSDVATTPGWGSYTSQHYLMAVSLSVPTTVTTSLTEASGSTYIPIKVPLGTNERGFAQATVVGDQIFVTTDSGTGDNDVNSAFYGNGASNTGKMYTATATAGGGSQLTVVSTPETTAGGAGGVAANGTDLYAASGGNEALLATHPTSAIGTSVNPATPTNLKRWLWLRSE